MALITPGPSKFENNRLNLFSNLMNFLWDTRSINTDITKKDELLEKASQRGLPTTLVGILLDEKNFVVDKLFTNVLDQSVYMSNDFLRLRKLFINLYSCNRSIITAQKKGVDPFFLSSDELDELLKSFGFPYPGLIRNKNNKVSFLFNLIEFYHRKGTPKVFAESLNYFGLTNTVLTEWWLVRKSNGDFVFRSKPIYPRTKRHDPNFIFEYDYSTVADSDVYWQISESQLLYDYNTKNITLPSITPYIGVHTHVDLSKLTSAICIMNKKLSETYEFWQQYVLNPVGTIDSLANIPDSTASIGEMYIVGDSPTGEFVGYSKYIATYTSSGWTFTNPSNQDVALVNTTDTHYVYNGSYWVNLGIKLPVSNLGSKRGNNNVPDSLYRDVTLNYFSDSYSFIEMIMAVDYLFSDPQDINPTKFYYYNGFYRPFDKGITGQIEESDPSSSSFLRDDLDDVDYQDVILEYEKAVDVTRSLTRENRDLRYTIYKQKFHRDANVADPSDPVNLIKYSSVFLDAMNHNFKTNIDNLLYKMSSSDLLESMFLDFEYHLMFRMKILDFPISHLLLGASVYSRLQDVIDFFKPYRARILDFIISFMLGNSLEDSQLEKDDITDALTLYFGEHGPWELDQGLIKDNFSHSTTSYFIDDLGRDDMDEYGYLDRILKDGCYYIIQQGKTDIDYTRDGDKDDYITMFFADTCPGQQEFLDSYTARDSVTIEEILVS